MATLCYAVIFLLIVAIVATMRLKPFFWITLLTFFLACITFCLPQPDFLIFFLWLLLVFSAVLATSTPIRMLLLTKPIYRKLSKTFQPMSDTEKQAIEAGGTGWEKELFSGRPDFHQLKSFPCPILSEEEKKFMDGPVEDLCHLLDDWEIHQKNDLPEKIWQFLKEHRFFGLLIPKKWGGLEFSAIAHSTIVMKIATRSLTASVTAMVPNSLGPGELILRYGTSEQKEYYLPRLAQGMEIPCFGLTSPEAGSDANALIDKGIVCKEVWEGREQICIRLNWDKRYITLAPVATLIALAFKLEDPQQIIGSTRRLGITLALIPATHPGVEIGNRHQPMHMAFMNGPVRGKNVLIPLDWIVGGVSHVGKGWEMMMECLSSGRGISLPALASGNAKMAFCLTGAYAYLREQFHLPIGQFEGVQEKLARIGGLSYLCEAVRTFTASAIDRHIHSGVASAITKYHLTEFGRVIINDAFDIHAGKAIQRGPGNYLANLYDAVPISITVEGANILTRNLIIFGQGAIRCHPYLKQEMDAVQEKSLEKFDKLLFKHMGHFLRNAFQTFLLSLGGYRFFPVPFHGFQGYYARKMLRMSSILALLSDVAFMLYGNALKRKESMSARLGDLLSDLYLASSLIKQSECQTLHERENARFAFQWAMEFCFHRMQTTLNLFLDNIKNPFIRFSLKTMILSFRKIGKAPLDALNKELSLVMMQNSGLREYMRQHCYIKQIESDPVGRVELAFKSWLETEPLRKKIKMAIKEKKIEEEEYSEPSLMTFIELGIISRPEASLILDAEKKRFGCLQVDEFLIKGETVK